MALSKNIERILCCFGLLAIVILVISDSSMHFDKQRVEIKRQANSPQHHWNVFYPQRYTYVDTSFKYRNDLLQISQLIEPNKIVLSDRATSYYLVSELPVYVKNVWRHHGRNYPLWTNLLDNLYACYIDQDRSLSEIQEFIAEFKQYAKDKKQPEFKYWVINRDPNNFNLRDDCLATRGSDIEQALPNIAREIYRGEYLWVYELN